MSTATALAGGTPLIRIRYRLDGRESEIFAKLEFYNPSGSIKDRMAAYILARAAERGELPAGRPIVEMTSGNTGIAFAALGALTGHPVHIFMPDWASRERRQLMEMYGARVYPVSAAQGGFAGALALAAQAAGELDAFQPRQFENADNPAAHYYGTGEEIARELPRVTDFVAGVGSGGTLMGTARRLKEQGPVRAVAVEPDAMPLLSGGTARGEHCIEGISDGFIPPIVDRRLLDGVRVVNDRDAVCMADRLARRLGLGVGISSGANFLGAALQDGVPGRTVCTVFPDDNKKYLSTVLASPPAVGPEMLAGRIELLDCGRA